MTDQIGPTGGLTVGTPATFSSIGAIGSTSGKSHSAKIADSVSRGQVDAAETKATDSPAKAAEQINSHLQQADTQLRIQVDAATGRAVYKIMDPATGQVVLQVPSEQVLAMAHSLQSMDKSAGASGVLLDKKG
jgi:flagellar protein FlaG